MNNRIFPRWSAPLVGMIAGAFCGLKGGLNAQIPIGWFILGGTVIGGLAGSLIFVIDPPPKEEPLFGMPMTFAIRAVENPSGVVGRFLAIAGCLLCWTPFLGFVLNLIGLAVNWRSNDWARTASIIGVLIGMLVAIATSVAMALELAE